MELTEQNLRMVVSDRALLTSFRASNPGLVALMREIGAEPTTAPVLVDFPTLDDVTAAQATMFDNHLGLTGKRIRKARWACNVRVWTGAVVDFAKPAWATNGVFWPATEAVARVRELQINKRNPVGDVTLGYVEALADQYDFIGLFKHTAPGDGSIYYEEHVLGLTITNGKPTGLRVFSPNASFDFPAFSSLGGDHRPLTGKAMAQSRFSEVPTRGNWTTGEVKPLT